MAFALDHLFVFTSLGAPVADRLVSFGLIEGSGNVHRGQGTANRRFFFQSSMLELMWVRDEDECRGEAIAPTGLAERAQFRLTGASPFGVCLRPSADTAMPTTLPFEAWSYRPPYLPEGLEIPVARTPVAEPLLFTTPIGHRPQGATKVRREPTEHVNGLRDISRVRITLGGDTPPSPSLQVVEQLESIAFVRGDEPLMELSFDRELRGESLDLRPEVALVLRW
jgi:hypothetical protein